MAEAAALAYVVFCMFAGYIVLLLALYIAIRVCTMAYYKSRDQFHNQGDQSWRSSISRARQKK